MALVTGFYTSECSSEHCWGHNPEVERTSFHHKPATTRCSSQDFWQRSEQKDLELACTIVSKKTIRNALNRRGLYARSPRKALLLKKLHLKFTAQHLDKPVKYWENIVWSDETKIVLFGCHNTHHVWRSNDTAHHPKNIMV